MTNEAADSALQGLRVLEICDEAGSYCGKLFADMGAEVIKLEVEEGDAARLLPPFWHGKADAQSSLSFLYNNTNKKSITLDINSSEGQLQVRKLASKCDLLIETLPPGRLAKLNLSPASLLEENPALVVTSLSGFGQNGPHRDYQSTDIVASALGGVMGVTGFADDPPVKLAGSQSSVVSSTMAAASSMIALYHSRQTGKGQHVDISTQECMLAASSICGVGKWLEDGIISKRFGSGLFASVPSGTYPCKDGSIYLMVNRPLHWKTLAGWVNEVSGNQEILDSMFEGPSSARQPYRELLDIFIGELTQQYSVEEFYRQAQQRHLAVTPLSTAHGIANDHHLNERGFYVDVEHGERGKLRYPGAPYHFSLTPWRINRSAPKVGEHNEQINRILEKETGAPRLKKPVAEKEKKNALEGLRVVEFTAGMAGPWIGRLMAFCGADVIRVESKKFPDVSRLFVPPKTPELGIQSQLSPWLTDWNAGKRCVSLDLTKQKAVDLAKRLIGESDIVIDNNANGVLKKLGLGFDELQKIKPGLILLSSTGYGKTGPDSSYISWGPNIETLSGLSNLSSFSHRNCTMTQFAYPDPLAALYGLFAIMCALAYREKTGQGQQINISQLEATVASIGDVLLEVFADDKEPEKPGNASLSHAPQGCYRCSDGVDGDERWCAISVVSEQQWQDFCVVLQSPQWINDKRFESLEKRRANQQELDKLIERCTIKHAPYQLMHALQGASVAAGVVQNVEDQWLRDPQLKARHFFEEIPHEKKGAVIATGLPLGLTATPGKTLHAGRAIGSDNQAVFCQLLGLSEFEYHSLLAEGVVEH